MRLKPVLTGLTAAALSLGCALASAQAVVEAVQMPAWVERDGGRQPVAPGMTLQGSDQLRTGANARLLLKMAEGSSVKLGENAILRLDALAQRKEQKDNVFVATMNVLEGAFRFTTAALAKARKRDVTIRVATVTAGVRGTDLWGKAATDRDIVCLIEGRIEVQRDGDPAIQMSDPLSFYIAPRGRPALPVQPVSKEQLEQWATETEIAPGRGALRRGGRWNVVLASGASENDVLRVYQSVREAGYAAELATAKTAGKRTYDARIAGLPSREEAQALAAALDGKYGVSGARVTQ